MLSTALVNRPPSLALQKYEFSGLILLFILVPWQLNLSPQEVDEQPGLGSPGIKVHLRGMDFVVDDVADPGGEE